MTAVLAGSGTLLTQCSPCDGLGRGASFDAQSVVLGPNKAGVVVALPYRTLEPLLDAAVLPATERTRGDLRARAGVSEWAFSRPEAFPDCQSCLSLSTSVPVELTAGGASAACTAQVVAAVEVGCEAGSPVLPIRTRGSSFGSHRIDLADCAELQLGSDPEAARGLAREVVEARAEAVADLPLGDLLFWRLQDMGVAPARVEVYSGDDALRLAMYPARTLPGPEVPADSVVVAPGDDLAFALAPSMLAVVAADLELREQNPPFRDAGRSPGHRPLLLSLTGAGARFNLTLRASRAEGCGWVDQASRATLRWDTDVAAGRFDQAPGARFVEIGGSEAGRPLTTRTRDAMVGQYLKQLGRQLQHRPYRGPAKQALSATTARLVGGFVHVGAALTDDLEPDFVEALPAPAEGPAEEREPGAEEAQPTGEGAAAPPVAPEEDSEPEVGGEEEAAEQAGQAPPVSDQTDPPEPPPSR